MKNLLILILVFSLFLITGCDELCDTSIKNVTEYIGSWTCVGQGTLGEIRGYANCKTSDGWTYVGDIWGSTFNGKGKMITPNGEVQDGYFYKGSLIAGKVTRGDGNSGKGIWGDNGRVELGKFYYKEDGKIEIGEFDINGNLLYGMIDAGNSFIIGKFKNTLPYNGYLVSPNACRKTVNGNLSEITRTVTNTVYRNTGSNGISNLIKLGSQLNPYNVNITIK